MSGERSGHDFVATEMDDFQIQRGAAMSTNYAVAPGEYLREWMDETGLSVEYVATRLSFSPDRVQKILSGERKLTVTDVGRLAYLTDIPERAWVGYEAVYRADIKRLALAENCPAHSTDLLADVVRQNRIASGEEPQLCTCRTLTCRRCGTSWTAPSEDCPNDQCSALTLAEKGLIWDGIEEGQDHMTEQPMWDAIEGVIAARFAAIEHLLELAEHPDAMRNPASESACDAHHPGERCRPGQNHPGVVR